MMQPRERLVLMIGVASCVSLLGATRGVPILTRYYAESATEASEAVNRLGKARAVTRASSVLADSLAARKGLLRALSPRLFSAKTPTMLASAASTTVSRMATAAHLRVGSLQLSADDRRTGPTRVVRIGLTATGDVRGVMHFLASVESAKKLIRVVSISVSEPNIGGDEHVPETLDFLVTLEAFGVMTGAR